MIGSSDFKSIHATIITAGSWAGNRHRDGELSAPAGPESPTVRARVGPRGTGRVQGRGRSAGPGRPSGSENPSR